MVLTCCLIEPFLHRLHPVADSLDGDGVVPAGLQLVDGEEGVLHHHAAAVSVESLQLIVLNLKNSQFSIVFGDQSSNYLPTSGTPVEMQDSISYLWFQIDFCSPN